MRKKNLRRFLVPAVLTLGVFAAGLGSTLAYFTDQDVKANGFVTGALDVGLTEPEWDPGEGDGKDLYPGCILYKNPTVKNVTDGKNGDEPCYVRLKVSVLDGEGNRITDEKALELICSTIYYDQSFNGGTSTGLVQGREPGCSLAELASYPMVNPLWKKDETRSVPGLLVFNYAGADGSGILGIGEESVLFTNIVIPVDWSEEEISLAGDFKLEIAAEAIQCQGFSGLEEAWKVYENGGKGADENTAGQEGSV